MVGLRRRLVAQIELLVAFLYFLPTAWMLPGPTPFDLHDQRPNEKCADHDQ